MNKTQQIQAIHDTATAVNGSVYKGYSGRNMYGKQCYGINCPDSQECIEELAIRGLRGAKIDQLGKGYIVYFPSIEYLPNE